MFGKLDVELQKCAIRFSEKYKEDIQIWIKNQLVGGHTETLHIGLNVGQTTMFRFL